MSSAALDIITHLTFISYIKPGNKINVKNNSIVESDSHQGSFMRYITGESRNHTLLYINDIITRSIDLFSKEDDNTKLTILTALRKSLEGINNLMITYENDRYIIAKLTSSSLRIEHFIRQVADNNE